MSEAGAGAGVGAGVGVWEACRQAAAVVCPRFLHFSMMCRAVLLQPGAHTDSWTLAVVCYRTHADPGTADPCCHLVGGSLKPKMVRPGALRVRLVSQDIVADTRNGEDPDLSKMEHDFRGQDFEKQFACRFKNATAGHQGVFGKVLVEYIRDPEESLAIFDFNLTLGAASLPPALRDAGTDNWTLLAVRELATILHITDDDNWRALSQHLGFTTAEVQVHLDPSPEPLSAMLTLYRARGGTADEFVQGLYEVSRRLTLGLHPAGHKSPVRHLSFPSQSPEKNPIRVPRPGRLSPLRFLQIPCDPAKSSMEQQDGMPAGSPPALGLSNSCPGLPLTPPPTPHRRRESLSDGGSPNKRVHRSSSDDTVFLFDLEENDLADRKCTVPLSDSVLWQVSALVQTKWKPLGRTLELPESELLCIEHTNRDLRECAYQTLLKWKDMFPQRFRYGLLYSALCENALNSVAHRFCTAAS